jgi:hypothetical protein
MSGMSAVGETGSTSGAGGAGEAREAKSLIPTVAKSLLRLFVKPTVIFFVFFAVIYSIIGVIAITTGEIPLGDVIEGFPPSFIMGNAIFLLVLGIVFPLWLSYYVAQGVTRREYALGLMLSGLLLSLFFAALNAMFLVCLPPGAFSPLDYTVVILPFSSFLAGWVCVIGFQFSRWFLAAAGIIIAVAIMQLLPMALERLSELLLLQGSYLYPAALLIITLATAFILFRLTLRIPLKCT